MRLGLLLCCALVVSGCAGLFGSGDRRTAALAADARADFEGQHLWGRPLETGIELGEDIRGESSSFSILWL